MIFKLEKHAFLFTLFSLTLFLLGGCKDPAEDSPGDSATDSVPILQDSDSSEGSGSMPADVDTADTSDSADSGTGTGISNETDSSLPHETPLTVGALILYLNKLCVFDFSVITDCETPPALVGGWTESGEDWTSTLTLKNDGTYTDAYTADGDTPETGSGNWCYSVDGLYTLSSVQSDGLIDNELNPVHVVENRLYWGLKRIATGTGGAGQIWFAILGECESNAATPQSPIESWIAQMRVEIDGQNFEYLEHASVNDENGESIHKEYVKGNVTVSGNEIIGTITETNRDDSPGEPIKCCLYENGNILSDCAFGEENVSDLDCSVPIHKTN